MKGPLRSLADGNYRLWFGGAIVSDVGTWLQRIAQDWLVLTQLTHNNATALGVVVALQFAPLLLLLPWTGSAADYFDRRKLLIGTQAALCILALALGVLTLTGFVQLWHVYLFALALGCVTAFDTPARQTFVAELVPEENLSNAVALNSTSFNMARMIGPAVAGLLIARIGTGWLFLLNGVSFAAVLFSLFFLRVDRLHRAARAPREPGGFVKGLRYVWERPDLRVVLVMLFFIGTFGLNFPIFISTMSVKEFHGGAEQYGLLMSSMAIGTIGGAVLSAGRGNPGIWVLALSALVFGVGLTLAALAPSYQLFAAALMLIGAAAVTFTTATSSFMQIATEPSMRGRVMALRIGVALGGAPIGAPVIGWLADALGPRWAIAIGGSSGFIAAFAALRRLSRRRQEVKQNAQNSASDGD